MFRLTVEREKRGWSKSELARRAKIALPDISRLESEKIFPYPGWKRRLARVFKMPGDRLFEVIENDKLG